MNYSEKYLKNSICLSIFIHNTILETGHVKDQRVSLERNFAMQQGPTQMKHLLQLNLQSKMKLLLQLNLQSKMKLPKEQQVHHLMHHPFPQQN